MIILSIATPETGHFLQVEENYFAENFPDNKFSFRVNGYVYLDEEDSIPFLKADKTKADVESIMPAVIDQDVLDWTLVIFAAMQTQQMMLNNQTLPEGFEELLNDDAIPTPTNKTLQ